jgi:hypothetical protein
MVNGKVAVVTILPVAILSKYEAKLILNEVYCSLIL